MSEDLRVPLAGLAAVLVPAVLGTAILAIGVDDRDRLDIVMGFGIGCVIAFPHLLFLGWPAWFAVSRRMPMGWWNAGLLGLVVGLAPAMLLSLLAAGLSIRAVRGADPRLRGEREA